MSKAVWAAFAALFLAAIMLSVDTPTRAFGIMAIRDQQSLSVTVEVGAPQAGSPTGGASSQGVSMVANVGSIAAGHHLFVGPKAVTLIGNAGGVITASCLYTVQINIGSSRNWSVMGALSDDLRASPYTTSALSSALAFRMYPVGQQPGNAPFKPLYSYVVNNSNYSVIYAGNVVSGPDTSRPFCVDVQATIPSGTPPGRYVTSVVYAFFSGPGGIGVLPTPAPSPAPTATPLPRGYVTTVTGGVCGYTDGPIASARLGHSWGIAVDSSGAIYYSDLDNKRIRKIANGSVMTLAGNGIAGYQDGPGTSAEFYTPMGIAVDSSDRVYVADLNNLRIRTISQTGYVTTLAGNGQIGLTDGPALSASFWNPSGVMTASGGVVFIADEVTVRRVAAGQVTTIAGDGHYGFRDGPALSAEFNGVEAMAADPSGDLYLGDVNNLRVRELLTSGQVITAAGNGVQGFVNGPAASAEFGGPIGVASDSVGTLYIADWSNNQVRELSNGIVQTLTGGAGGTNYGFQDGPANTALFYQPVSLAVGPGPSLYVTDEVHCAVRRVQL